MITEILSGFRKVTSMKTMLILLIPVLLSFALVSSSASEIYKWKDSRGNIFYTDTPPAGVEVEEKRYRLDRIERPAVKEEESGSTRDSAVVKRPYGDINVTMYMTSWCPYCRKARELINSLGVHLTEYDIDKDKIRSEEMVSKGRGKGVPLIDVEGIVIRGFAADAIKEAIERRRGTEH